MGERSGKSLVFSIDGKREVNLRTLSKYFKTMLETHERFLRSFSDGPLILLIRFSCNRRDVIFSIRGENINVSKNEMYWHEAPGCH